MAPGPVHPGLKAHCISLEPAHFCFMAEKTAGFLYIMA